MLSQFQVGVTLHIECKQLVSRKLLSSSSSHSDVRPYMHDSEDCSGECGIALPSKFHHRGGLVYTRRVLDTLALTQLRVHGLEKRLGTRLGYPRGVVLISLATLKRAVYLHRPKSAVR